MNSLSETPSPTRPASAGNPRMPRLLKFFFGSVVVLLILLLCGLFFLYRLERQVIQLGEQGRETRQALKQVESGARTALIEATGARASAQQAAEERNEAEKVATQSQNEARLAHAQAQTAQNEATLAEQKAAQYQQERQAELNRLQQVLGQIAETRRTAMGVIMTLGNNSIQFDFDKASLRPGNREILSRIAGVLMMLKGYHISVFGYTDDIGTQQYNLKLSERRAQAVRGYLVRAGLNPNIITAKGFGKSDPRVPGDTPQARAINRRVEIGIVDSTLRFPGSAEN
ncbi:MAG: OmpA family protein [Terriglobia bacterium]